MGEGVEVSGTTFTVDAGLVAEAFGLGVEELRALMRDGAITTRHERGEGEDEGRARLSFLYRGLTFRLTIDEKSGVILSRARFGGTPGLQDLPGRH